MPPPGLARGPRWPACWCGVLYLGWLPATVACAASGTLGSDLSAVRRGALRLLDGGEFHQVSHLAVKVPLGRILRLWQCLQEDRSRRDVLACTELLRELHVGIIDDVAVDSAHAMTCGARGVYPLWPGGGPWRLVHGWGRVLPPKMKILAVGLRVGERSRAVV